jgi:endonuclease/exonuclease/phosphatase family metal-dependent hydrolase
MSEHRIKILSWNLWHGLNHTQPSIMWPLEDSSTRFKREALALNALKEQIDAAPTDQIVLAGLQEVNPVAPKTALWAKSLRCQSKHCEVNVGIKVGPFNYPFHLREGLAYLWRGPLNHTHSERLMLTGAQYFDQGPVTLQLSERRGSLWLRGQIGSMSVLFVNTHLHHGSPGHGGFNEQRMSEIKKILAHLQGKDPADLTIMMGDFNFESQHPEMAEMLAAGFSEARLGQKSLITWSPANNSLTRKNSLLNDSQASHDWDAAEHAFDHIFYKVRDPNALSVTVESHSTFGTNTVEGLSLSDHYGLGTDLRIETTV